MTLVKRNNGRTQLGLPTFWEDFLNRDVFSWGSDYTNSGNSMPAVNIREKTDSFLVEMAAPGMDKKDFKINLDGHTLTISSEKQEKEEKEEGSFSRREFSYQSFYRTFHLPKDVVDADKIQAKYENGVLQLEIPKREEAKPKPARIIDIV